MRLVDADEYLLEMNLSDVHEIYGKGLLAEIALRVEIEASTLGFLIDFDDICDHLRSLGGI